MTGIDWAALSRLVPEAVIVVIFCVFVLAMQKRQDEYNARREQERQEETRRRDVAAEKAEEKREEALGKREQEWRDFLREERTQHAASLGAVVSELRAIAALTQATNTLVAQHDTWARNEALRRGTPPT